MEQKIAVVTGASKGIGLEIAKMLLGRDYTVYGLARRPGADDGVCWISCDVTDRQSVEKVFSRILEKEDRIDLLVCNAGIGISGAAEFAPQEDYRRQMEVNFDGAVDCVQQAAPLMRKQKSGRIVFISSLAAIFPLPFQSFYSASKAALNAFSDALGIEMAPFGVQTCTMMLNDVKTDFTDNRKKTVQGDDIYGGRIASSVGKMEKSERSGMAPREVADTLGRLLDRRKLPPHKIVGASNEFLGLLFRLLPAGVMLRLLGKLYG